MKQAWTVSSRLWWLNVCEHVCISSVFKQNTKVFRVKWLIIKSVCRWNVTELHWIKLIGPLTLTGHRMHHAGTGTGKAAHVPEWGVRADAGLLAERTPAEDGHQRHPQLPADAGQESPSLPGHPGLKRPTGGSSLQMWKPSFHPFWGNYTKCPSLLFQPRCWRKSLQQPFVAELPHRQPPKRFSAVTVCRALSSVKFSRQS